MTCTRERANVTSLRTPDHPTHRGSLTDKESVTVSVWGSVSESETGHVSMTDSVSGHARESRRESEKGSVTESETGTPLRTAGEKSETRTVCASESVSVIIMHGGRSWNE